MSAKALACHDIVEQIVRLLVDTQTDHNDNTIMRKQDILSCALTCRSFLGPALGVLWYSLNSLVPLLKLLPNFKAESGYYSLTGKITEKDWTNFDAHAKLVREFIYTDIDSPDHIVLPSVYLRLAQCRPKPLPHLMRFNCPCSTAAITETLLFLSPLLERVEFKNVSTVAKTANIEMFLSFLADESVSLQSLYMEGNASKSLLSSICHFKQLRSLELLGGRDNVIDEEDLVNLGASLPHLTKLSLEANVSSSTQSRPEETHLFSNVNDLTLFGSTTSISSILKIISAEQLEKFELHIPETSDSDQPHIQYVVNQAASRWSQTLSSLKIYLTDGNDVDSRGWGDDSTNGSDLSINHFLQPIYQHPWPNLKVLTINRDLGWSCSNGEITKLVSTWPLLKELELSLNAPKYTQLPTLSSLYTIAHYCPDLVSLRITLNLRDVKDIHIHLSSSSFIPHHLDHLFIDTEHAVDDIILLIQHLDTVFPYLQSLLGRKDAQSDWVEIQRILKLCQKVRASERRRLKG
ncbi:hypothetical protein VKT23_019684 [Stygiomarasmius scandens]|uniref:Uncharacterized protein n=1 Tax=Marasmiellus scandens TaxID=2682957 RepID=A0ABR1IKX7_9AGAR